MWGWVSHFVLAQMNEMGATGVPSPGCQQLPVFLPVSTC